METAGSVSAFWLLSLKTKTPRLRSCLEFSIKFHMHCFVSSKYIFHRWCRTGGAEVICLHIFFVLIFEFRSQFDIYRVIKYKISQKFWKVNRAYIAIPLIHWNLPVCPRVQIFTVITNRFTKFCTNVLVPVSPQLFLVLSELLQNSIRFALQFAMLLKGMQV